VGEISKDVSAFANSDGGVIVYGIVEQEHRPQSLDTGIDHTRWPREWLESTIQSNVAPILDGLTVTQLPVSETHSLYVVSVPKSYRAPHQDRSSFRYYKRHNFKSSPMEDYEVQDVRSRRQTLPPLISFDVSIDQSVFVNLCVENIGDVAATDVKFQFTPELVWERGVPPAIRDGIKALPPRGRFAFMYSDVHKTFSGQSSVVKRFSATVSYFHSGAQRTVSDFFEVDIASFEHTLIEQTELHLHGKRLEASIEKLIQKADAIEKRLERLEPLAGPTGLNLSVATLRSLASIMGVEARIEPIDPSSLGYRGFREVLGCDEQIALNLYRYFQYERRTSKLEDTKGVPAEVLALVRKHFLIDGPPSEV